MQPCWLVLELKNYYCCNGIIPGFSQSGGLGSLLAQWIVEGEPELDVFGWDVARYGKWADKPFTKARALDCYANRFKIHFPYEEREAGRAVRTRPVYELQKSLGAVFGLNYGWEHALWYAGAGQQVEESYGFERQNCFDYIAKECKTLREHAGLLDVSNFAKYEVKGAGAGDWLDRVVANKVPRENGRSCLAPLLGKRGGVAGDFTITQLAEDHYWMVGSGMAERYHLRFFDAVARPDTVSFESRTESHAGFNLAGSKARAILATLTDTPLDNESFRFMRSVQASVGGIDAILLRVSFTGDLGWEIYVPVAQQLPLYEALLAAGEPQGMVPVGSRSLLSLRLEKGYGSWGREYSPEYWPQEVGLERLIKLDKPEFLGREVYMALKDNPLREKLVMLEIDVTTADATGGEPIFLADGTAVGHITSGAYGHSVGASLALGFIRSPYLDHAEFDVAILGKPHKARILDKPLFDPQGERLRS